MEDELSGLLGLTALAAALASLLIAPVALALGLLLARRDFALKPVVEALVLLPLVVPPVATGLVLLKLFGRRGPAGGVLHRLGMDVAFTPAGVVIAMAVMSLPVFVLMARVAFESVDPRLEQVAATLGAGRARVLTTVTLPLAWPGLLAAAVLSFARAVGEFGATMMIAGAIPGRTTTLSTAIWQHVQMGDDASAQRLMMLSVALALAATSVAGVLARRARRRR